MLINNVNAENYGVVSTSFNFGMAEVTTYEDWLKAAPSPIMYEQTVQYGTCVLETMVAAKTRNELENNISKLTAALTNSEVEFDSVTGSFVGFLTDRAIERLNACLSKVTFTLQGRRLAAMQERTFRTWGVTAAGGYNDLIVEGSADVPFILTFTPLQTGGSLVLRINRNEYYQFNGLVADTKYVLDTATGEFYSMPNGSVKNNEIDKYAEYSFPMLKAGNNNIGFTSSTIRMLDPVIIEVQGRWQ